jgi:dimethylargininase
MNRLAAIVREVSPSIGDCELSFLNREPIDVGRAVAQHRTYCECLSQLGVRIVALPAEPSLPDAVFVEDTAVVVDEVAVITFPGAESRRPEVVAVAEALARFRPLEYMAGPGTLDGGDVLRVGRTFYVGQTARSNAVGADQLRAFLAPFGYTVKTVAVDGCLHLKSGVSCIAGNTVLANRKWVDAGELGDVEIVDVPESEPWAANTVAVAGTVILSSAFPETRRLLERRGYQVRSLDISEIQKAEGGLSCMSILLG